MSLLIVTPKVAIAHFDALHRRRIPVANGAQRTWRWLARATDMERFTRIGHRMCVGRVDGRTGIPLGEVSTG